MNVVIIGAGNLGLVCAARMAAKGIAVTMLTGLPEKWTNLAEADDCDGRHFEGPFTVMSDPSCVATADLVFLCLPGNAMKVKLPQIVPHLRKGTPVMSIFAGDGFFFVMEELLGVSWPALGFQRVPFIARTKTPYRLGGIKGYKKELFLAHRNIANPECWRQFAVDFTDTKTTLLDNFYDAAFINANMVMHPARLMSLKKQIDEHGPFKRMPLFYEEWDDVASDWAIRLDEEVCAVATKMGAHIQPFLEYYESTDIPSLTRKIRSIAAFKGIGSPITADGYIDYTSRYIQSDVHIALKYIAVLAHDLELLSTSMDCALCIFMEEKI